MVTPHLAPRPLVAGGAALHFDPLVALAHHEAAPRWRSGPGEYVGFDERSGLWLITGNATVGQACCDPVTFGEPVVLAAADHAPAWRAALTRPPVGASAVPLEVRARAVLRMVWPATLAQAELVWGRRFRVHAGQAAAALAGVPGDATSWSGDGGAHVDRLACAMVGSAFGVSGSTIGDLRILCDGLMDACTTTVAKALLPLAVLREMLGRVVRDRAAEPVDVLNAETPDAVVDDLLGCRGLGTDRMPLDDITALCCALFATAWDATAGLLPRLVDALRLAAAKDPAAIASLTTDAERRADFIATAPPPLPPMAGWLRITTQSVLLHEVRVPADVPCLLLLDTALGDARPLSPQLAAMRWLAPAAPDGAGMTLARLTAEHLLAALAHRLATRPGFVSGPSTTALPARGSG